MKKIKKIRRKAPTALQRLTNKYAKLTPEERAEAHDLHTRAFNQASQQWAIKDREPWSKPQTRPVGPIQPFPSAFERDLDARVGIQRADLSDDPAERGETLEDFNRSTKKYEDVIADADKLLQELEVEFKTNLPAAPPLGPLGDGSGDKEYLKQQLVPAVVGQLLSVQLPKTELPKEAGTYVIELGEGGSLNEVHRITATPPPVPEGEKFVLEDEFVPQPVLTIRESWWERFFNWFKE